MGNICNTKYSLVMSKLKNFFESRFFMIFVALFSVLFWLLDIAFLPYIVFIVVFSLLILSGASFVSLPNLFIYTMAVNRTIKKDINSNSLVFIIIGMLIPFGILIVDIIKNRKLYFKRIKGDSIIISMVLLLIPIIISFIGSVAIKDSLKRTGLYLEIILLPVLYMLKTERNEENNKKLAFSFFAIFLVILFQFIPVFIDILQNDRDTWEQINDKHIGLGWIISNHYMIIVSISMIVMFYLYVAENNYFLKALYLLSLILGGIMSVITFCRASWVGLFCSVPFLLYAYIRYTKNWKREIPYLVSIVVALGVIWLVFNKYDIFDHMFSHATGGDGLGNGRQYLWQYAIDALNDNWIKGSGFGTSHYIITQNGRWEQNYHNLFVQASTAGILGVVVFGVQILMIFRRVFINKGSLFGVIVGTVFIFTIINGSVDTVYFNKVVTPLFMMLFLALPGRKLPDLTYQEDIE